MLGVHFLADTGDATAGLNVNSQEFDLVSPNALFYCLRHSHATILAKRLQNSQICQIGLPS